MHSIAKYKHINVFYKCNVHSRCDMVMWRWGFASFISYVHVCVLLVSRCARIYYLARSIVDYSHRSYISIRIYRIIIWYDREFCDKFFFIISIFIGMISLYGVCVCKCCKGIISTHNTRLIGTLKLSGSSESFLFEEREWLDFAYIFYMGNVPCKFKGHII